MQKKILENKNSEISLSIPADTLECLGEVARRKDLPLKALLKFYIGQGLRQDLTEEEASGLARQRLKSRNTSARPDKNLAA